jgi:hypothetical protein
MSNFWVYMTGSRFYMSVFAADSRELSVILEDVY